MYPRVTASPADGEPLRAAGPAAVQRHLHLCHVPHQAAQSPPPHARAARRRVGGPLSPHRHLSAGRPDPHQPAARRRRHARRNRRGGSAEADLLHRAGLLLWAWVCVLRRRPAGREPIHRSGHRRALLESAVRPAAGVPTAPHPAGVGDVGASEA